MDIWSIRDTFPVVNWKADPNGLITRYSYDSAGDLISTTDPQGKTETFTYAPVPEPASLLLLSSGLAALGVRRRRTTA